MSKTLAIDELADADLRHRLRTALLARAYDGTEQHWLDCGSDGSPCGAATIPADHHARRRGRDRDAHLGAGWLPVTIFSLRRRSSAPSAEAIRSLRRLLKYSKRVCGLTCIDARKEQEIPAQQENPGPADPAVKEKTL
jgi:hypothetical protein